MSQTEMHFTPAELAYLAVAGGSTAGERSADALLAGDVLSPTVLHSGYGSLRLRELIGPGSDGAIDGATVGVARTLSEANRWVSVGFLTDLGFSGLQLFLGDGLSAVVSPLEAGVLSVTAATRDQAVSQAHSFANAVLNSGRFGVLTAQDQSEAATRSLLASHQEPGGWELKVSDAPGGASDAHPVANGLEESSVYLAKWLELAGEPVL